MIHPDESTIERFVMGALDDDAEFVSHVSSCEECSRRVEREARLELDLLDVARLASPVEARDPKVAPLRRRARWLGPALGVAAGVTLAVWAGRQHRQKVHPEPVANAVRLVSCPDGDDQLRCIGEANRAGAHLEYPTDPRLASLGREPGLSLVVEPLLSDGTPAELDDYLARVKSDLTACARAAIVEQDAPVMGGKLSIKFVIGARGGVAEDQTVLVVRGPRPPADADPDAAPVNWKMSRCLGKTSESFPFQGSGTPVHVGLTATYVWRE